MREGYVINEELAERYRQLEWWEGITFAEVFNKTVKNHPKKLAVIDQYGTCTYKEYEQKVNALARGLCDQTCPIWR